MCVVVVVVVFNFYPWHWLTKDGLSTIKRAHHLLCAGLCACPEICSASNSVQATKVLQMRL